MTDYLNRNFLLSYVASFVSLFGSKLLMISYVAFIFGATGSATLASVVFAADWIANLFVGLLFTRMIDRGDARRMLVGLNLAAAAVTGCFLLSLQPDQFAVAVSIIFARALLNSAVNVARVKALVQFFDERETNRFSAVFNSSQLIAVAVAGAVGTVILQFTGMAAVVVLAVVTFLVSAGFFALVRPDRARIAQARAAAEDEADGGAIAHLRAAAAIIARSNVHATAVFYIVVEVALLQATYEVLIASAPQNWYTMGESGTALFFTVEFLAYTAGVFLYEFLTRRGLVPEGRQRRLTVYAIGLAMVAYLTMPLVHSNLLVCLAVFSVLVASGKLIWAHQYKRMIAHTADNRVSSVVGLLGAIGYSLMAVCGFVFSWAMGAIGIVGAITVDVLLLAVLVVLWERRTSRKAAELPTTTRSPAVRTAVLVATRGLEAFRPDLLRHRDEVRLVGIFTHQDVELHLSEQQAACFDAIHLVPSSLPDPPPLLVHRIDVEAAYAALAGEIPPDGQVTVHCYSEQNMLEAAELRERFALPGPYPDEVVPYIDKLEMKDRLVRAGVRVPAFGRWEPRRHAQERAAWYEHIVTHVGLPFIIKPTDMAGSAGVEKIASYKDFAALPADLGTAYEYEEFIDGTMYSVNTLTADGHTVFGGVTEYLVNSSQVVDGHVNADINLADDDPRVARMVAFAGQAMDALGRLDGAAHLELFHTAEDELVFLEVGARFKGMNGLVAMQRNYGVALVNWALEIESGIESRPYDAPPLPCFDACVPLRAGVIDALLEPNVASECEMHWSVRPGQRVEQTDNLVTTGGTFLVWNPDYAALYRDFYALRDCHPVSYVRDPAAA